ncbi:MAG: type IV pilus assembly protein PilM, partial [bacterium]
IVSSVSGPSVIVRHVQFPPMSQKELIQSLKWEAKSYIPFPADEVNLDYQILPGKNENHGMDVILVAVTKKLLHSHLEILKDVSIEPDIVDIAPLVLINTYLAAHPDKKHKTVALMYIGAQSSLLSIYRPGSLFFTRDINIAGDAFTKHIQAKWNISYAQAESIKHGENVVDDESFARNKEVQEVLKPVINELIKEVRRSLVYYDNQTGKMGFGNLVLTGGGALLAGISEVIGSELGLEVEFLDPFKRLHVDEAGHPELLMKEHAERLSLSLGLALRGII